MIPFDFEYYRPTSVAEAVETYEALSNSGKKVVFYSGGTEFITFARMEQCLAEAVIDLKAIPECNRMEIEEKKLVIGLAVSLNKISESNLFPLLSQTVKKIADHTSRNKITLGGNINSKLIYREGILPLLLTDCQVKIVGNEGEKTRALKDVFQREMKTNKGQFFTQVVIDKTLIECPFISIKKTKISKIGYPVVSIAALVKDKQVRVAFSGVCEYPFRSVEIETTLNDSSLSIEERIEQTIERLPVPIVNDIQASAEYRTFVLKNTLLEMMEGLEVTKR